MYLNEVQYLWQMGPISKMLSKEQTEVVPKVAITQKGIKP